MKDMLIATRSLQFTDAYGSGEIVKGERIDPDHELVKMFPDVWRAFTLQDELKIRSDCIAEMREREARPAGRVAMSEAGREELRQQDFWRATEALLERTAPNQPTSEEQREQAFYDQALASLESMETRELAEVNADAVRDYGFNRGWSRRISD